MAENKKSFILYADLLHTVRKMSKQKAGELFITILRYVNDENPVVNDKTIDLVFESIKHQLKRDLIRWEEIKLERAQAGRLGGIKSGESRRSKQMLQKRSKTKQNEANEAVTVNVNVNERGKAEKKLPPAVFENNLNRKPVIPTKNEVLESFLKNGGTIEMAKSFYDRSESVGWFYKGSPITDFRNQVYSFIENWKKNESKSNGETKSSAPLKYL